MQSTDLHRWPSGDCRKIASIRIPEGQSAAETPLRAASGYDPGSGRWHAFAGELPSGCAVELLCHKESSHPDQYILRVDSAVALEEDAQILSAVLRELGLDDGAVVWRFYSAE